MRLIDADGLLKILPTEEINSRLAVVYMPTIDPVRHGRWFHGKEISRDYIGPTCVGIHYENWWCSECGCVVEDEEPTWNYCPYCGAKMDEVEE